MDFTEIDYAVAREGLDASPYSTTACGWGAAGALAATLDTNLSIHEVAATPPPAS